MKKEKMPEGIDNYFAELSTWFKISSAAVCLVHVIADAVLFILVIQKKYATGLFRDSSESFKLSRKEEFDTFITDIDKMSILVAENQVKLLKALNKEK